MPRVETKCCIRRWWLSWGDGQVPPVLCCVVLCCIWVTAARVRWNSCYASPVSEPALLTWTRERRLCVTRPRWSLLLPPHRAALTSSWCFQSYSRKRLTWHISCQGVQTCDLSDMWVSVQPLPNNTALPVRILTSQKWDKYQIIRNVKGIKTLAMWVEIPAVIAKSWSFKVCGPSSFSVHLISARQ